jgi:hypothetical protein
MKLSLRFVLPLVLVLVAIAYGVVPLVNQLTLRWIVRDLDMRSALIANTVQEPLAEQLAASKKAKISGFLRVSHRTSVSMRSDTAHLSPRQKSHGAGETAGRAGTRGG